MSDHFFHVGAFLRDAPAPRDSGAEPVSAPLDHPDSAAPPPPFDKAGAASPLSQEDAIGSSAAPTCASLTCASPHPNRRTSRTAFASEPPDPDDPLLGFAPYAHKQPRRNAITPDRQRAFIAALAATGIVTQAAREIGASMEALYKLRNRAGAEGFAAAWEEAIDRGVARLEDCALERAIAGEERIVVRGGEVVATWRHYDTKLMLFLLRQRRSHRFDRGGGASFTKLKAGNPVYERLKREWVAEAHEEEQALHDSIDEMFDTMARNRRENSIELGKLKILPDGSELRLSKEAWEREEAERRARGWADGGDHEEAAI